MKKLKKKVIPKFKAEARERAFWANHDASEYLDWTKAQRALLPNLKPSVRTISLRLPEPLIARLKVLANKRDVPYQSLLKVLLVERLKQEEAKQVLGERLGDTQRDSPPVLDLLENPPTPNEKLRAAARALPKRTTLARGRQTLPVGLGGGWRRDAGHRREK
jgi:predicted DNA binding CopG/RHH family protein